MFLTTAGQLTIIFLMLFFHRTAASEIATAFCSSINTADSSTGASNIYNSDGACHDKCEADYAFGIMQGKECWCSNFAPGTSVANSECSDPCPGFPSDTCGNADQQLFEYIALNLQPSGTQGASSSAAAPSSSIAPVTVTDTPAPITVIETPSLAPSPSFSSSTPSPSLSPIVLVSTSTTTAQPTTAAPSSTSSSDPPSTSSTKPSSTASSPTASSSTWTPTPVASIETVTNGQIRTVTITPTSPPGSVASETTTAKQKSGSSSSLTGGQAAGLTIGLIAFIAIVAGIVFFCWRKRKQQKEMTDYSGISRQGSMLVPNGHQPPSRTMSENSRYVLATDGRAVYPAWENDDHTTGGSGSRSSRFVPVDPRLDPYAGIYQQPGMNRSHESMNTIHDGRDYSRRVATGTVLRATNPDPEI